MWCNLAYQFSGGSERFNAGYSLDRKGQVYKGLQDHTRSLDVTNILRKFGEYLTLTADSATHGHDYKLFVNHTPG